MKSCIPSSRLKDDEEVNQEVPQNYVTQPPTSHSVCHVEYPAPISWQPMSNTRRSPPPSQPLPTSKISEEHNWQATQTTVRERNAVMFNNPLMADVQFVVGTAPNVKTFPAHKYVLATGSSVFFAMFYGGLANELNNIGIPDVEPAAFLNMLRYLYCDEIKLGADTVLPTLYAAKKYIVPHLAKTCVRYLETSLSARNACVLLSQGRLFEEVELMQRCWEVIDAQAEEAFKSDGFTDIDYKTLETILSRETLNCREITIFDAMLRWAETECRRRDLEPTPENKRSVISDCLFLIRMSSMTLEEFADGPAQSGILTLSETTDLFLYFTAHNKPDLKFINKTRKGLTQYHVHRFQSSAYRSNQWRYRGRCDSIQFSVDKRVFIAGFGLYGSSNGSSEYTVRIELKKNGVILGQNLIKFKSDGSSNTFPVMFETPIQVEADMFYTASAVLDGTELSYFGQEGMAEIQYGKVTFQFQCSSDSTNGTGVQGGQIPELIYYG